MNKEDLEKDGNHYRIKGFYRQYENSLLPEIGYDGNLQMYYLEFDSSDSEGYVVARFTYYWENLEDLLLELGLPADSFSNHEKKISEKLDSILERLEKLE